MTLVSGLIVMIAVMFMIQVLTLILFSAFFAHFKTTNNEVLRLQRAYEDTIRRRSR